MSSVLKESDVEITIKLPYIDSFKSRSKKDDHCPYGKVHRYLQKQLKNKHGIADAKAEGYSASDIYVTTKTHDEIRQAVAEWIPFWKSWLLPDSRKFNSTLGMMELDYAFNQADESFMEDNTMYLVKPSCLWRTP